MQSRLIKQIFMELNRNGEKNDRKHPKQIENTNQGFKFHNAPIKTVKIFQLVKKQEKKKQEQYQQLQKNILITIVKMTKTK